MKHMRFECTCATPNHTLRVTRWEDGTATISVALNRYLPLWKRIGIGIAYILGFDTDTEQYDTVELSPQDRERLKGSL